MVTFASLVNGTTLAFVLVSFCLEPPRLLGRHLWVNVAVSRLHAPSLVRWYCVWRGAVVDRVP